MSRRLAVPVPLRVSLLRLAALPLVPVVLLVMVLVVLQAMRQQDDAQANVSRVARSLASAVDARLRETEAGLLALGASSPLQEEDFEAFRHRALAFEKATGLGNVVLLDASGRQVVNTALPPGAPLPVLGPSAPALPVIRTGRPLAGIFRAALTGRPIVVVSVPVNVRGELRYALSQVIGAQRIEALLLEQHLPATWIGAVLDPAGLVVARTSESHRFLGLPASQHLRDAVARAPEGAFEGITLEGVAVRTVYAGGERFGWSVALGVPSAELQREFEVLLLWLTLGSLLAFGIAAGLAWWHARRIGRTVARLTHAARALGHGAPVEVGPMGILEADQLAAAMAQASADIEAANALAAQAHEEVSQMAVEASRVREEEKSRIARELHDELAQSLAVVRMELARFGGEAAARDPGTKAAIDRMVGEIDASVAATRRIAADLRPLVLDDLGLAAAIEWLAGQLSARTGVPCAVRLAEGMDLKEPYATGVFRVVQEALSNVAKHAQAGSAEVRAEWRGDELVLSIADDGVGFAPGEPRKPESLGLVGLRERVQLLHGELTIASRPGNGTRLEVRIPVPAHAMPA